MLIRLTMLVAALGAIVAMMGGCGGDDDSSSSAVSVSTSSLSKAEYIKKATAACERESQGVLQKANAYLKKHESDGLPQPVLEARAAQAVLLPVVEAKTDAVRQLGAPAGDEQKIEAMLSAQQQAVEDAKDFEVASPNDTIYDFFTASDNKFKAYNLTQCSSSI